MLAGLFIAVISLILAAMGLVLLPLLVVPVVAKLTQGSRNSF